MLVCSCLHSIKGRALHALMLLDSGFSSALYLHFTPSQTFFAFLWFFFCFHLPPAFNICHLPCTFYPFSFLLFSPHFPPTCNSLPLLCMSSYFKDRRTCHLLHHLNATRNPAISRCFGWMQINIFAKLTMEIIYFCTFNSGFWHYILSEMNGQISQICVLEC